MKRFVILLIVLLFIIPITTVSAQNEICSARLDASFAHTYANNLWLSCDIGNNHLVQLFHDSTQTSTFYTDINLFWYNTQGYVNPGGADGSYFTVVIIVPYGSDLVPALNTSTNFCAGEQTTQIPQWGVPIACLTHHDRSNYWNDGVATQLTVTNKSNHPITTFSFVDDQINTVIQLTDHSIYNIFVSAIPAHTSCSTLTLGSRWYNAAPNGLLRRVMENGVLVKQPNEDGFRFNTEVTLQPDQFGQHCYQITAVNDNSPNIFSFFVHTGNNEYVMAHWLMPHPVYFDMAAAPRITPYTSSCYHTPQILGGIPMLSPFTSAPFLPNICN